MSIVDNGKKFQILSIDGGGIRGIVPAHIVYCLESRLSKKLSEHFDMIAGTSTGSIIAAAIACEIDSKRVVDLYRESGEKIFCTNKAWWMPRVLQPILQSMYINTVLKDKLKEVFGDIKLGDISKPLILPATDIGNGGVHVFKSNYCSNFTRDKDVFVRDAVLASCSAPTFFNPVKVSEYALADGGLWANNPSLVAIIDAQYRLKKDLKDLKVLSIGTGHSKTFYGVDLDRSWGFASGWRHKEFISFILSLQSQTTQNYMQLLLDKSQLLRLDFESDNPLPLDDCSIIGDLLSRADKIFTHSSEDLDKFLKY